MPIIPDYDLLKRIGGGGYGEVWLARSQATGILRAAKVIWRRTFDDERPFLREFEGLQKFERLSREHPSQIALFHVGRNEAEAYLYYVMELADDLGSDACSYAPHTLRAELKSGRMPAARVLAIGLALTEALGHLHRNGLVHRDVKPSNVIFVNGRPKLADIGLVTDASDQCSIVGTEGYLSPEGPGTPQADLFALGKVLYEAALGMDRRQFPRLLEDLRSWPDANLIFELNEVVLKACASSTRQRYASAQQMHAELALLRSGGSVKKRRFLANAVAIGAKLALGAALALAIATASSLFHGFGKPNSLSASPEAAKLYRQAMYRLHKSTPSDFRQAFTNFTEAIKLDPKFLKAHYGLFEIYWCDGGRAFPPKFDYQANMAWLASQLRAIDSDSAEFHVVNSYVEWLGWRFDEALREVERAIQREPTFVRAQALKGFYLLHTWGNVRGAQAAYEAAERIDPTDLFTQIQFGHLCYFQRDYNRAIAQYQKVVALEPKYEAAHAWLGRAYEADGHYAKALEEYETGALLLGDDTDKIKTRFADLRHCLALGGPTRWRQAELDSLKENSSSNFYRMGQLCNQLGFTNEIFPYLEKAYAKHNTFMCWLRFDPTWDSWRRDRRFQQIVKNVGFPPTTQLP